jgi:NAD-dependent DNA ligase
MAMKPTPEQIDRYEEVVADISYAIDLLTRLLITADKSYRKGEYTGMCDYEFDRAMKALEQLELGWPGLKRPGTPTEHLTKE